VPDHVQTVLNGCDRHTTVGRRDYAILLLVAQFASSAISMIATMALTRAGIDNVFHKGAHLFLHSLATQLLRAGASLTQIGQVLRHQDHDTTRIWVTV
jgi:site-specific recombinase XerD